MKSISSFCSSFCSFLCVISTRFQFICRAFTLNKKMPVSYHLFRDFGLLVGFLGAFGILVNKRQILLSIICIERRFYGLNFFLVVLSVYLDDRLGELFGLFVLTLAAAESALALALLTAYFRVYGNILLREDLISIIFYLFN